jgi:MSHA biogenesis protein MshO
MPRRRSSPGFTLVEFVMVITLSAIVFGAISSFMSAPMESYFVATRRALLVEGAEDAMRRLERDIQAALPNSVRVFPGNDSIEFLHVSDAAVFRSYTGAGHMDASDVLTFEDAGDASFNVLSPSFAPEIGPFSRVVLYPTGANQAWGTYTHIGLIDANAAVPSIITAGGNGITLVSDAPDETQIQLDLPHQFRTDDSETAARLYVIDTAINYRCAGGELIRESEYSAPVTQVFNPVGGAEATVTNLLATTNGCTFTYNSGGSPSMRSAIVTIQFILESGPETVEILHQVHVNNVP